MKKQNRDLILITKQNELSKTEIEQTIIGLDFVLLSVENFVSVCKSCEVFDLKKYKIYRATNDVAYYLRNKYTKPYIFIFNRN